MRKILIIDDESLARVRLKRYLLESKVACEIAESENGMEGLEKIKMWQPQILFLDIEMPGLNGFEMLGHLEEKNFVTVFQTAYDAFAVKAFEECACDYILKPYTRERFLIALDRALERTQFEEEISKKKLKHMHNASQKYLEKLVVKSGIYRHVISVEEIVCFISKDHYTFIHTEDGQELICDVSLSHLEMQLNPQQFFRSHRKSIVSLKFIKRLHLAKELYIELKNGQKIDCARRRTSVLQEVLANF